MTVSNAYNKPDQLSAQTRDAVLAMARSLGYSGPSAAGRSLRRGMSGTVGVVLTERLPYAFTDPGTIAFLHGLATELADARRALQRPDHSSDATPGEHHNRHQHPARRVLVGARLSKRDRCSGAVPAGAAGMFVTGS